MVKVGQLLDFCYNASASTFFVKAHAKKLTAIFQLLTDDDQFDVLFQKLVCILLVSFR